jgi:SAM-dependent methyltransferase
VLLPADSSLPGQTPAQEARWPSIVRAAARVEKLKSSAMIESSYLTATAEAYDAFAVRYADFARNELDRLPLDRAVLAAFAEFVRAAGAGRVAELGCGPGRVTAHLRDLRLDAFGVDLSPVMIDLARDAYPDLRFEVGSMDALDLADGELDGIVSWYSIIHTPPQELPPYFAEFRRVLAPGGHLLLAFFESEGETVVPHDHKVTPAYRWPIDDLAELARETEFVEVGRMLREPREEERFRRGHLLMRRQ